MPSSSSHVSYAAAVSALLLLPFLADARACTEGFVEEANKLNITAAANCKLNTLGAEMAWSFDNGSRQLAVAFGARLESSTAWLAWGLNPSGPHMVGTRALIGIKHETGLAHRQFNITDATKRRCQLIPSDDDVGLNVTTFTFDYLHNIGYYLIHAVMVLPHLYNSSAAHVVWEIGEAAVDGHPSMHPRSLDHLDAAQTVDLLTGKELSYKPAQRARLRAAHGVLNMVGWGIFIPTGTIVARYFRSYPKPVKWWGAIHIGCQSAGYIVGSTGWATGLWLGQASKYYTFATHRILAIMIFTFTTIQMMALRLKPRRTDEYRSYWNMYHHFLGYSLIAAAAVNIFQGINIIESGDHQHSWRLSYVGVLGLLGGVALALELYTWIKFCLFTSKNPNSSQSNVTPLCKLNQSMHVATVVTPPCKLNQSTHVATVEEGSEVAVEDEE